MCPGCGFPLCTLDPSTPTLAAAPPKRRMLVGWSAIVAVLYGLIQLSFLGILSGGRVDSGVTLFVAIMILCQWSLIKVPVQIEAKRPLKRTALWIPVVMTGFFMSMNLLGLWLSISDAFVGDAVLSPSVWIGYLMAVTFFGSWISWGVVFWRMSRSTSVPAVVVKQNRLLLRGSILELLIAVPSHIVARNRPECCAGLYSAIGIWLGLSVALLAFGPSLFFLYAARYRKLRRL
jgi:hypothetical protein